MTYTYRVHLLLSDGSSLASRQAAGLLARAGHDVGVLSDDRWALTAWTRSVRRRHPCPRYGDDPLAWLDVALRVAVDEGYDVLVPTQEQAAALSAAADRVAAAGVRTAVPPFSALAAVQDKATASATLDRLGLPQPPTTVVSTGEERAAWDRFPVFAKLPVATASTGVARCSSAADLRAFAPDAPQLVLQEPAPGPLAMVQTVWCRGEMVAAHVNERVAEGVGGGASRKRSLDRPDVVALLERLGAALDWHGALCADVILSPSGPVVIDVNPRLVEPANAAASGVDLVGALVDTAFDRAAIQPPSTPDVETHQVLLAALGAAQRGEGRPAIAREVGAAVRRRGAYAASREELTPIRGDLRTALPVAGVVGLALARPSAWRWFAGGSVAGYALSPDGWDQLVAHHARAGAPA
jgi:biotin carboxylase